MTRALPLSDLVVLDLTIARAGPTAVRQLADWGADVIRIEPRRAQPMSEEAASPDYRNLHRNKRSLALDLKRAEGRAVLHRLIPRADVLVENLRPPVKARLGFDWPTVHRLNPRLVMGSISGFGQDGPYAERGGVDQIVQGMGGLMSVTGLPGQGPVRAGVAISDVTAGLQLAVGLLVALHERDRTGVGRWVTTSLLESMIGMLDFQAARYTVAGEVPAQEGNHHPTLRPMGLYATRDGALNVAAPWGRLWDGFCRVLGHPEWASDPRYASLRERARHRDELDRRIAERLRERDTADWLAAFHAESVPSGPVLDVGQVFSDPQVEHLEMAVPIPADPDAPTGSFEASARSADATPTPTPRILRNATRIDGHAHTIRRPAPEAGAHSRALLRQFGFETAEIERLVADEVV